MRVAHFPRRAPIDAYGNGGFRFADMSHRGSILCLPSGIYGIEMASPLPTEHDLAKVWEESETIEILLVGTGKELLRLPGALQEKLRNRFISTDSMSTGAAVRTFNVLLAEDRAVAALLFAVI